MKTRMGIGMLMLVTGTPFVRAQDSPSAAAETAATETTAVTAPRRARSLDEITVVLLIDTDSLGRPMNIVVEQTSGNRDIDRLAVNTAKKWKFEPEKKSGRAVPGRIRVPVGFKSGG